jgi:hypothetical protein
MVEGRVWGLLLLAGAAAACGGGGGASFQRQQVGTALAGGVAGTSFSDVWGILDIVDQNNKPVAGVGHATAPPLWQDIDLPQIATVHGGFDTDGPGAIWIAGSTKASVPDFLRVHSDGTIEDFAADVPAGVSAGSQFSLRARAGGVFATVSVTAAAGPAQAMLLSLQGGHLQPVAGFPSGIGAVVLAVVGPDEAYVWINAVVSLRIVHYAAGVFTDVPGATALNGGPDNFVVDVSSPGEIWVHTGAIADGSQIVHGDGTHWQTLTVSGWPSSAGASSVRFVPRGAGRASIVAWRSTRPPGPNLPSSAELDVVEMAPNGSVGGLRTLATCRDSRDCAISFADTALLDDGTLLLVANGRGTWFVGQASGL